MVALTNRNGFYYALDRVTGKFIAERSYVKQTCAKGLDEAGRAMRLPKATPSVEAPLIWPSLAGGSNRYSSTYNPKMDLYYLNVKEMAALYHKGDDDYKPGALFNGGGRREYTAEDPFGAVRALGVGTGELRWENKPHAPSHSGLMSTAGGLVFGSNESSAFALDAQKGELLRRFETGGGVDASPIMFMHENKQYVSIAAGHSLLVFSVD